MCIISIFIRFGSQLHAKYMIPLCKALLPWLAWLAPFRILHSLLKLVLINNWTESSNIEVWWGSITIVKLFNRERKVFHIGTNNLLVIIPNLVVFGVGMYVTAIKH